MELQLHHLKVICAISAAGSLHKAAANLGVSQPALSAQLQRIERTLGARLFDRSPRGVLLTPYGRSVSEQALGVLDAVADIQCGITAYEAERQRLAQRALRIGYPSGALCPSQLRALTGLHLDREVVLRSAACSADLHGLLAADRLDAAVILRRADEHEPPGDTLHNIWLGTAQTRVLLAADHDLTARDQIDLAALADERWAVPHAGDVNWAEWLRETYAHMGLTPSIRYRAADHAELVDLVAAGLAVAPIVGAGYAAAHGTCVARPLRAPNAALGHLLIWSPTSLTEVGASRIAAVIRAPVAAAAAA